MNYDRHECNNSLRHKEYILVIDFLTQYTAHWDHCIDFDLQVDFLVFYLPFYCLEEYFLRDCLINVAFS